MIKRVGKNLTVLTAEVPAGSVQLERDGYTVLRDVLTPRRDRRDRRRDRRCLRALSRRTRSRRQGRVPLRDAQPRRRVPGRGRPRRILEVIEPLLGDDCHVIANTAWRNPPEFGGGPWHCDAGPHVPRPTACRGTTASRIRCSRSARTSCSAGLPARPDGPTAVVPGSHRIGRLAPFDRHERRRPHLRRPAAGAARRRRRATSRCSCPTSGIAARRRERRRRAGCFLQAHYGRRDIAQRIRTTADVNHLSPEAIERAKTPRERDLVGLHDPFFYDG